MSGRIAEAVLGAILGIAVVLSGVRVVTAKHEARRLFAEIEELKREHDRLQDEWGRLEIEQSTQATHARVESLAHQRLGLDAPEAAQLKIVVEPGT